MKTGTLPLLTLLMLLSSAFLIFAYLTQQWFQHFRSQTIGQTHISLKELFLHMSGASLFTLCLGLGALLSVLLLVIGHYTLSIVPLLAALAAPKLLVRWLFVRRLQTIDSFLPDAMIMIAGAVRAGAGLQVAIQNFCQNNPRQALAQEFQILLAETRLGVAMDQALTNMNSRLRTDDFLLVTTAIRIARETGGNLSETLERLADTLRQKAIMEGKIKSLTAQGKLQGIVVGLLPLFLMFVLFRLEPEAMGYLFNSLTGWLTIAVIVILELLGIWMIRKIVTIDI